jgi:DNA polymerase III subunit chi
MAKLAGKADKATDFACLPCAPERHGLSRGLRRGKVPRVVAGQHNVMTEILFYHLERRGLDDVLPGLVEKTLERGWRALIRPESAERAQAIDNLLWAYNDQTFLPHAQSGDGEASRQPVLISPEDGNPNSAEVLFVVGGAHAPAWDGDAAKALTRIVVMFDGRDPEALQSARTAWKGARESGHDVTYWKETPGGKWEKQA